LYYKSTGGHYSNLYDQEHERYEPLKPIIMENSKTYGSWKVTTEGDVEGKSIKYLGDFIGNLEDIAFHLANKCFYSLRFTKLEEINEYEITNKDVNISFDNLYSTEDLLPAAKELFSDNPTVLVEKSNFYNSVRLRTTKKVTPDKRAEALAKLSTEDKKVLGLLK